MAHSRRQEPAGDSRRCAQQRVSQLMRIIARNSPIEDEPEECYLPAKAIFAPGPRWRRLALRVLPEPDVLPASIGDSADIGDVEYFRQLPKERADRLAGLAFKRPRQRI